jgi:predicted transposase/invertase (TIGR01784 family)
MASGIDPKVDYVVKRLFGEEENALLLVDLLNAVIRFPAGKRVRGVMLLNPFMAKDYAESKIPIFDVWARDDPGRQFLVELQQFVRPGFPKRLLYYWAVSHADQLLKGEGYELLLPTYAICFVNETLFPDAVYHHTFQGYDLANGASLCKDQEIHVIELNKFDVPVELVLTQLERWCYYLKHGAELDPETLPATLDEPVIRKAMEVLMEISQNELDRHRFLDRQKAERDAADQAAWVRNARKLGYDEGEEKGIEKGIEKGKLIGRIQLLQQLLKQPETSNEDLGRLSQEALLQMEDSLKQKLTSQKEVNGTRPTDQP